MTAQDDPSGPEGISLDELAQAFAQVMGTAPKLRPAAPQEPLSDATTRPKTGGASGDTPRGEDPCPISPSSVLEAMLFVGSADNQPLSAERIGQTMRDVEPAEAADLVEQLNRRYDAGGCPYHVVQESGGYRMVLRKEFESLRFRFQGRIRQARLTQAAIDVLAIVAYQQPLSAEQVSKRRGKPSSHVLAQLVQRRLLRVERESGKRRIGLYHTTDRFLRLFGLETLADLPRSDDQG
jgi:segregation and condensation protein B